MPAKEKPKRVINLLPKDEFEVSTAGRVLKWAITTFRMIVISVEIVVVGSFLARFSFDAKNADLDHSLEQKSSYIASFSEFEREFKNIQAKAEVLTEYTASQNQRVPTITSIVSKIPGDIQLTSLRVTDEDINISGQTTSEQSISQLIVNLKKDELFTDIALTEIGTQRDTPFVKFSLKIEIKT
ncbi:MAG: Fimbrial assembly family protein [Candidatus Woesebacteria bacterium GW2011_GWB1_43_14]|uniref:Fimbrial assembly family protein n=1 Tax=Candidatus Woesebacteria bacterium GW2011_GWB1_43_14 TaxID=1618578 RepID=A0A0G1DHU2_9BACT|nr:MAG: Fimbrial assembly family protein [Candidatus Woesebacteria bacterium GW2011_GWA1_39_11b]KKS77986.1 MAG: Fimbrial assembly family protein [Candidatus Woesebacteria bacterium GW2011_GWC1_42_9]KKS97435.1 MAG: Fimbrial assembly family protein [Candidatus Woesebacteria bacterium GW2011_GWB1_43_14]